MNVTPCYPPTPRQQELLDCLEAAQREMDEALRLYQQARAEAETWHSRASLEAQARVVDAEIAAWRTGLRLDDLAAALSRHFQAEDALRSALATSGVA